MTLAIILLLNFSCAISFNSGAGRHSLSPQQAQSASPDKPTSPPDAQSQLPSQAPSATTPSQTPLAKPAHRKKKTKADCNPESANSGPGKDSTAPSPAQKNPSSNDKATKPKGSAAANCPPQKIIVQQGGSSEPTIQLVGTPGGTPSAQERDTTQKLHSAEDNLKKMESENLDSSHQDMIKQIRQFIHESKIATAAGDLDRASTLADKAKLLSEELLIPQK